MHVNVLRVYTALLPSGATQDRIAGQLNWPSTAFLPGAPSNPTTATLFDNPARANWGTVTVNVSLTAACNGVAVTKVWLNTESNQSVLQPPASGATSTTNNYYVRLKNTGTGAAPGGILAKINSYRFGISGGPAFGPVPASPNPLGPSSAVPSGGGTADLGPAVWTLSASDYQSTYASNSLVCSFVLLDVDPAFTGRTLVANRYFYWNTHYGTASKFRHVAYLDTRGFAAPNDRSGMQHFDLRVFPKQVPVIGDRSDPRRDANLADRIRAAATEDELQQLGATALFKEGQKFYRQTVCGYRSTGRYVQMGGGDMELMENTPCFSYWLRHKGEVTRWTATLAGGDGVKQLSPTKLSASLQQGTAIALTTDIEAEEPRGTSWPGRTCSMLSASSSMVLLAGIVGIGAGTAGILHRRRRRRDDA
jgi:hypothetical protein